MTYAATETSQASGSPVELYEFVLGSQFYRFTSGEDTINYSGVDWEPVPIRRTSIQVSQEVRTQAVEITLPSSNPLVARYILNVPGKKAVLTIRRFHFLDGAAEVAVVWKGIIQTIGFTQDGFNARVAVLPLTSALSREIPRFTFQGPCNHLLYGEGCEVVAGDHLLETTVSAVSGNVITITGLSAVPAPADFVAGFVELNGVDFRMILSVSGDDATLLIPFEEDITGMNIKVFEGCAHNIATCKSQFDNVGRYGGFAFVPLRNLFSTGIQ